MRFHLFCSTRYTVHRLSGGFLMRIFLIFPIRIWKIPGLSLLHELVKYSGLGYRAPCGINSSVLFEIWQHKASLLEVDYQPFGVREAWFHNTVLLLEKHFWSKASMEQTSTGMKMREEEFQSVNSCQPDPRAHRVRDTVVSEC